MANYNDALHLLADDHMQVRRILACLVEEPDLTEERRVRLLEELDHELDVHNRLEEELFYPALLRRLGEPRYRRRIADACAEHRAASQMMAPALRELDALDDEKSEVPDLETRRRADAAMRVIIERHCHEEEVDLFALARQTLSPRERADLAAKMEARKQELFDQRLGA